MFYCVLFSSLHVSPLQGLNFLKQIQQNKLEPFESLETEMDKSPHKHATLCTTHRISKTQHQLSKHMTKDSP